MRAERDKSKPVDRWLAIIALTATIVFFFLPRTHSSVVGSLVLIFFLLIYPVWNLWWIERSLTRRIVAVLLLLAMLIMFGKAVWTPKESRSHIHVYTFQSSPQELGEPAMVNVMFENDGKSKATEGVACQIVFFQIRNFDPTEESQREDSLFASFEEEAQKRFQDGPRFDVPAGRKSFTTCFGPKYSSQAMELIRTHQFRLYYVGIFKYSDSTGRYQTTFCGYTETDPNVFFVCNKYNDEP